MSCIRDVPRTHCAPFRSYTHCKEIEQETCYNLPVVTNEEMEVTLAFPEATRDGRIISG